MAMNTTSSFGWDTCTLQRKSCVGWVEKYFGDCIFDVKSDLSFVLGLLSLVAWAVAEIPQIVTNFRAKSGHGVSLALLLTWVVGDIFNLVGCHLEPATLPTQFYTALLYTATTVVLVLQTLYYDYFLKWWKGRSFDSKAEDDDDDEKKLLEPKLEDESEPTSTTLPTRSSPPIDFYFTSARSLASSGTPYGSPYLTTGRSGPTSNEVRDNEDESSSESEGENQDPAPPLHYRIPRSVRFGASVSWSANLPSRGSALIHIQLGLVGRKVLEEKRMNAFGSHVYGLVFGWIMAAIYMGGRLPQIYLNINRGSVEGLNPLMFMFALFANVTYVGSILVRSIEWERIRANAPWLLDAVVCVLLDLFILAQFAYYKFMRREGRSQGNNQQFEDAKTPLM